MQTAHPAGALVALALLAAAAPPAAAIAPNDDVISAVVEEGEREIDFKTGTAKARDGQRASRSSIAFGTSPTAWWFTELYAIWHKPPGERAGFDAWEWENKFQLTETGKYPVDVTLMIELERPKDRAEGWEVRWGPLMQADIGSQVQANLNLLLTKNYRAEEAGKAQLGYQWQLKYRWKPELEFGVQGFGDLGGWNDWDAGREQAHVIGPALHGRYKIGPHQALKFNAAYLRGLTHGSPRDMLRLQAELEF